MLLTSDQQRDVARKACWYFDCYFGFLSSDSVVFTGDGIDDLDRIISRLEANAADNPIGNQRFQCDTGAQYSDWRNFDIEDLRAIRAFYLEYYGDVNKPDVYVPGSSSAFFTQTASE